MSQEVVTFEKSELCIVNLTSGAFAPRFLFIEISVFGLTQAQYILIHQALLEQNQFGETEIPVPELHSTLSTLKQRSSANESSLMEDEFEVSFK